MNLAPFKDPVSHMCLASTCVLPALRQHPGLLHKTWQVRILLLLWQIFLLLNSVKHLGKTPLSSWLSLYIEEVSWSKIRTSMTDPKYSQVTEWMPCSSLRVVRQNANHVYSYWFHTEFRNVNLSLIGSKEVICIVSFGIQLNCNLIVTSWQFHSNQLAILSRSP